MYSRVFSIALLSVGFTSLAHADMPHYDVEAHCRSVAAIGGAPSQMILQGCYQQEQSSYNALKPRWDTLPGSLKAYCNDVATLGGDGSYMMLNGCVQQEEASANANSGFQFKR